jgi:drug/metabolite transporter (DMT)-like permease
MRGMDDKRDSRTKLMYGVIGLQWVWGILIAVVPFGFDHPSSLGLDFDDAIVAMLVFAVLCVAAVTYAVVNRNPVGLPLAVIPIVGWLSPFVL